jgi:4-carboxymuconolactone decarboxylase
MRLKPLRPDELTAEQETLYASISKGIESSLQGFTAKQPDGALVGPFNAMIHFPELGKSLWDYNVALAKHGALPKSVRETAILVVGARFTARYEIYAHERVARTAGMTERQIAAVSSGQRPADLSGEDSIAYDIAAVLVRGAQLPESLYLVGKQQFGDKGLAELIQLIGCYCLVSVLLNAYDVPVPQDTEI